MPPQPMQQNPQWQPSGNVFLVGPLIAGMLDGIQEQYTTLVEARPTPHILNDYTVGRLVEVYPKQRDDLWLWDEQLTRWSGEALNVIRRRAVERLHGQMAALHKVVDDILALADEWGRGTIETVPTRDDAEMGLEMLCARLVSGSREWVHRACPSFSSAAQWT